jgi:putative DNA primase/helicase
LLFRWFPDGRIEGREFLIGNLVGERGRSLKINLETGKWADFERGDGGIDLVALYAAKHGLDSQGDAAARLAAELGLDPGTLPAHRAEVVDVPRNRDATWTPILPVPDGAPPPPGGHSAMGRPAHVAEYRDAEGRLLAFIHRYEPDSGERKQIMPLTLCRSDAGRILWRWQGMPKPRPLYGLDLLAARPDAPVLVVEGEPKCDAARRLVGDRLVVVAWPGGAGAVRHANWAALAGRKVAIWPDADAPGVAAAEEIAGIIEGDAARVRIIDPPAGVAEGWDLADAEREGWTGDRAAAHIRAAARPLRAPEPPPVPHDDAPPPAPRGAADSDDVLPEFQPLGHDRGRYYFMTLRGQQVVDGSARDLANHAWLLQLAPAMFWEGEFPGREGFSARAAANWLMAECYRVGVYDPARIRGRGAWVDDGRVVLHLGDRVLCDGDEAAPAAFPSRCIYERGRPLDVPLAKPLPTREASALIDLCMQVSWEDREAMGRQLAGWLVVAPVCGAIPWRPHLWITSEAGAGKSWVLDNIVKPVLGPIALHVQSKTSEAGLRGELGQDARPIVFDEAETQNQADRARMQLILDLARQASSEAGAEIIKGTQQGGARRYRVRSCFAFSSINVGLEQAADESRTLVLQIVPSTDAAERSDQFDRLKAAAVELLKPDFGARLMARTLKLLPVIRANAEVFADAIAKQAGSRRTGDTFGVVLAGAWSLRSAKAVTPAEAERFISERAWAQAAIERQASEPEWKKALNVALQVPVEIERSNGRPQRVTVGEVAAWLAGLAPDMAVQRADADRALRRAGVMIANAKQDGDGPRARTGPPMVWFAQDGVALRSAFERTPWGTSWPRVLARAPGAQAPRSSMYFGYESRAVGVGVQLLRADEP